MKDNDDLLATFDAMGATFRDYMATVDAARQRRSEVTRAREEAQRDAARQAELERLQAEVQAEVDAEARADAGWPEGPLCGDVYHDSRGREVSCRLAKGHEADDPECNAGNGVTWPYYGD